MIVEYIRYKIDPSRNDEFDEAYRRAGMLLDASPHCQRWEAARCVDEPEKQIVRIDSDSAEGHLQGFRQSADVSPSAALAPPSSPASPVRPSSSSRIRRSTRLAERGNGPKVNQLVPDFLTNDPVQTVAPIRRAQPSS
jgi:hypothetical protein